MIQRFLITLARAAIMSRTDTYNTEATRQGTTEQMATWPLPLVVAIEGNIGVGKSTQVKRLQDLFEDDERVVVLPEPVDEWVDKGFLKAMYENANDPWLLSSFQHMVLMSLAGDLHKALARTPTPAIIITERSPFGAL